MKKIVKPSKPSETVSLDNLHLEDDNIIAFKHERGHVGILTRQDFSEGYFKIVCLNNGTTDGNSWDCCGEHEILEAFIQDMMSHGDFFLFENVEEFSHWLVNNC